MSSPAIEVTGLSKRYVIEHESRHDNLRDTLHHAARKLWRRARWGTGFEREEFWALRDVSFSVQPGEVIGVIGRNGAGKSTLLKILSRITEPTAGKVAINGRVASLLEVGTGFHPDLTGRENIFLNGAILGMSRAEIRRKFDEIVTFAEVERFLDTPVKRYSSGMYVRLAFAVAAHLEPEILIVDEVLAVGDAAFQKKCLGKMREVATGQGRTVLFVSHNMNAVKALCSRAVWLQEGKVHRIGPTYTCLSDYLAPSDDARRSEIDASQIGQGRPGDGRARFRKLRLVTANGSPATEFMLGEPFILEVEIDAFEAMSSYVVGFHVATSDQQIVVCSNHYDTLPTQPLAKGLHRLRCRFDGVTLAPGDYALSFAITSAGGVCHDMLRDTLGFTISSVIHRATQQNAHFLDGRPGLVRSVMEWEKIH